MGLSGRSRRVKAGAGWRERGSWRKRGKRRGRNGAFGASFHSLLPGRLLSIFAPAERVFTTYSSCPHVQDSPSLLRWESGKGLLAPHPKPSYSGAVSYRTLNPSRRLACGGGLLEFTISPHVDAQMPENWKVTGPCLFLFLFFLILKITGGKCTFKVSSNAKNGCY